MTKLRATSLVALLLLPATVLLAFAPTASAALGDTLVANSVAIVPGNPCNAWGPAGGVAVKEAGTASVLYYASDNVSKIWMTNAYMPTAAPPPCLGSISPAVSGATGWTALAYDAYHASVRIWGARNDGVGTIVGLTLSGSVVATIPGAGAPVTGLAVDEASPNHLFVATGSIAVRRYSTAGVPALQSTVTFSSDVSHLAAWGGALLGADGSDWVRNHRVDGSWLGMLFHPGDTFVDPWFQVSRWHRGYEDMALDEQTYASTGKLALWTVSDAPSTTCVSQCPQLECTQWEGPDCIQWTCIANCGGGVYVTVVKPTLRAHEVKRTCPGGQNVPPTQECVCPAPAPQPAFTSPTNAIHLRGVPTSASATPIVVQGAALVTATAPSTSHVVSIRGPLPSATTVSGYGSATAAPLVAAAVPRGAYTYEASVYDAALGCRGGTQKLTVWVEDPTSWTQAQAVRVAGSVPIDIVAGSIRARPLDDLVGFESAIVVDRAASGSILYDVEAFEANASHEPMPGLERFLAANARAVALEADALVDLATLCYDLTGQSACSSLPRVKLSEDDLRAEASAGMELVTGNSDASAWASFHEGRVAEATTGASADTSTAVCPLGPCTVTIGPMEIRFGDAWSRTGPLHAESYAAALRIEVSEGPYRGEIVFSEAYAGISLGGRALLDGPTQFVEVPDDFATGADAPSSAGPALAPGTYGGSFEGADRVDSFQVATAIGQKLRVVVDPAHRLGAHAAPVPTAPHALVAPRLLDVTLVAPDGTIRDRSTLGVLDAHPAFVELNVDLSGPWTIVVRRLDTRDETAPYTVSIEQRGIVLLAGDDASTCSGATALGGAPVLASMGATDAADTFALNVAPGEAVTAVLKSDDLEGADFDLRLLDSGCNLLAQSTLGKDPMPKGEPDRFVQTVVPAGTTFVQVVRVNGIGNYALEATSLKKVV